MKFGKKPFVPSSRDLKFAKYRAGIPLPPHPRTFGHEALVDVPWGMLANDAVGDCVFAGAAHETMLFNAEAGRRVVFDDACVVGDYSVVTGYVPGDESTDQGTDVRRAMDYRRSTGIVDSAGTRHKLGVALLVDHTNLDELFEAVWLGGALGLGIRMPQSAEDQFDQGQSWSPVSGSPIGGGHYVSLVALRSAGYLGGLFDWMPLNGLRDGIVVTWGRLQPVTLSFLAEYVDEAWALFSEERLLGGKSLDGLDRDGILADLQAIPPAA